MCAAVHDETYCDFISNGCDCLWGHHWRDTLLEAVLTEIIKLLKQSDFNSDKGRTPDDQVWNRNEEENSEGQWNY